MSVLEGRRHAFFVFSFKFAWRRATARHQRDADAWRCVANDGAQPPE